jgi:hypothetical protein
MGEPPFIHSAPTTLSPGAAFDCVVRTLNRGDYLVLDANRDSGFIKAQAQRRGGQFHVQDVIDQVTVTVYADEQNRTIVRAAVATTVDNKPDEPSERGIAATTAVVDACIR